MQRYLLIYSIQINFLRWTYLLRFNAMFSFIFLEFAFNFCMLILHFICMKFLFCLLLIRRLLCVVCVVSLWWYQCTPWSTHSNVRKDMRARAHTPSFVFITGCPSYLARATTISKTGITPSKPQGLDAHTLSIWLLENVCVRAWIEGDPFCFWLITILNWNPWFYRFLKSTKQFVFEWWHVIVLSSLYGIFSHSY